VATYLGLVGAIEGASVTRPHGFTLVRGPGYFSFCNFAAGFVGGDARQIAAVLLEQAEACLGFYVFLMTGDEPADLHERLGDAGFQVRQTLVGMAAVGHSGEPETGATAVTDLKERRAVASFMARQFFWRMPKDGRDAIAAATALGPHTLWAVGPVHEPEAAVMLVEQPDSVGLFNLCVRPDLRRKGLGSRVVGAVGAHAARQGKPVVLQCEAELAAWYREQGFREVSRVDALSLAPDSVGDILDT
jgi:ribosomal protein S18 acetylase RimI-like enzyme